MRLRRTPLADVPGGSRLASALGVLGSLLFVLRTFLLGSLLSPCSIRRYGVGRTHRRTPTQRISESAYDPPKFANYSSLSLMFHHSPRILFITAVYKYSVLQVPQGITFCTDCLLVAVNSCCLCMCYLWGI